MSAFLGVLRKDGEASNRNLLTDIAEAMRFRGPDGVSVWCGDGIGGCFALMRTPSRRCAGVESDGCIAICVAESANHCPALLSVVN